jgi:hypothetical protein
MGIKNISNKSYKEKSNTQYSFSETKFSKYLNKPDRTHQNCYAMHTFFNFIMVQTESGTCFQSVIEVGAVIAQ